MDMINFKATVKDNFLSTKSYESVYETINKQIKQNLDNNIGKYEHGFEVVDNNGFVVYFDKFEKDVLDEIKDGLEKIVGHPVNKPGVLFARYTKDSGYRPRLRPHADRAIKHPSVTATLELDTTLDWDIYINDDNFNLKNNEILVFSGSNDIHWRPDAEFDDNDYFDVIICQTSLDKEDDQVLDDEYFKTMDVKSGQYIHKYRNLLEKSL